MLVLYYWCMYFRTHGTTKSCLYLFRQHWWMPFGWLWLFNVSRKTGEQIVRLRINWKSICIIFGKWDFKCNVLFRIGWLILNVISQIHVVLCFCCCCFNIAISCLYRIFPIWYSYICRILINLARFSGSPWHLRFHMEPSNAHHLLGIK